MSEVVMLFVVGLMGWCRESGTDTERARLVGQAGEGETNIVSFDFSFATSVILDFTRGAAGQAVSGEARDSAGAFMYGNAEFLGSLGHS